MNEQTVNPNTVQKPRRQWWRIIGISFASLLAAGVTLLCWAVWWLYGWRCGEVMDFHESWTADERAALMELDSYLRGEYVDIILRETCDSEAWSTENLAVDVMLASGLRPALAQLEAVAHCGHARNLPAEGILTMSPDIFGNKVEFHIGILAAQCGRLEALKAMLEHGLNPQCRMPINDWGTNVTAETLLSPVLSGHFVNGEKLPWSKRREYAEALVSRGAKLNGERMIPLSCQIPLFSEEQDPEPYLWALEHGLMMNSADFQFALGQRAALPIVRCAVEHNLTNVNDFSTGEAALQVLVRCALEEAELPDWKFDERLELLLSAGADPNLVPDPSRIVRSPEEDESNYEERLSAAGSNDSPPLSMIDQALACPSGLDEARIALLNRLRDRLIAAGAIPLPIEDSGEEECEDDDEK